MHCTSFERTDKTDAIRTKGLSFFSRGTHSKRAEPKSFKKKKKNVNKKHIYEYHNER